ncbi:MAG: diaminopimelate decarboxylase, partial [Bacteroidaceae bacterium]
MDFNSIVNKFEKKATPFYYYDTELLLSTLQKIKEAVGSNHYQIHYAVKANSNPSILRIIAEAGLGADCVSGGEIEACLKAGFPANKIVFAGVGKMDWEINLGIENDIETFNVESKPELEIINELARAKGKIARIAFRINPNVDAHTHANITTGLNENKFGISMDDMEEAILCAKAMDHVEYVGLHFHIGSQILHFECFEELCKRINELQTKLETKGITTPSLNVGGGLGIDYDHPNRYPIPDFKEYINVFRKNLELRPNQMLHFELGRSVVAQCGSMITKVIYVKQAALKQFVIVDGGFTDLIRPALYQAFHKIENVCSTDVKEKYDVVGPICESSDVFDKDILLNRTKRGDYLAIRSAGAYGEVMASTYNCRHLI